MHTIKFEFYDKALHVIVSLPRRQSVIRRRKDSAHLIVRLNCAQQRLGHTISLPGKNKHCKKLLYIQRGLWNIYRRILFEFRIFAVGSE